MQYNKPPLPINKQCDRLIQRGLIIKNRDLATKTLSEINYYRLSAYFLPFQKDKKKHMFYPGIKFEKILKLYNFDAKLRNILMPVIEAVEILIRTKITYHLSTKYNDPFCYLKKEIYSKQFLGEQIFKERFLSFFDRDKIDSIWETLYKNEYIDKKGNVKNKELKNEDFLLFSPEEINNIRQILQVSPYDEWMEKMRRSIEKSKEVFVQHYKETYFKDSPGFPIWMITEIISFGQISMLYKGLNKEDRKEIAKYYEASANVLVNWLHSMTYLRNICAHHSRLWNRTFKVPPKRPKDVPSDLWSNKLFPYLIVLKKMSPKSFSWRKIVWKLKWLFWNNRFIDINKMGFPKNWPYVLKKAVKYSNCG